MPRFIIRRLLITIPTIFVVITLTWGLIRLAPGNFYSGEKKIPKSIENNIREKYGLNRPWYVQYARTMSHIVRLDFGTSLKYEGQSVNAIIARSVPVSATIGLLAYLLAYIDRSNLGVAKLQMQTDLRFSDATIGLGAGIFFIGYFLLEIPGSLIVERYSARKWFARIMISWGLVATLTGFIGNSGQFYVSPSCCS